MSDIAPTADVSALTVQRLSAYLANNGVPSEQLAELIRSTRAALSNDEGQIGELDKPQVFTAAVSTRKSLASPEHIISLIDGKPYKTLKRHLASRGLTPDEYRSRYNLPANYPTVAPAYAEHRRAVAHRLGLGRKISSSEKVDGPEPTSVAADTQSSSEPDAVASALEQPKNAPARTTPRRKNGTDVEQGGEITRTNNAASDANRSEGTAEPSGNIKRSKSGIHAAGKEKRIIAEKKIKGKGGTPRGKVDAAAIGGAATAMMDPPAQATNDTPDSKSARRRGKIALFKASNADVGSSTHGAGSSQNPIAAQKVERMRDNDAGFLTTGAKARAPKRKARAPKSTAT